MGKLQIINIHIENDLRNGAPTVVYTDKHGGQWVHEEQSSVHGGFVTALVKKENSFYWKK